MIDTKLIHLLESVLGKGGADCIRTLNLKGTTNQLSKQSIIQWI